MLKACLLFITFVAIGTVVTAQDDARYQTWMKSLGSSVAAIRNAPDNAAAAGDASKLANTFDKVAEFWRTRNAEDAVKFSRDCSRCRKSNRIRKRR
jgi:hypothetical protein